MTASQAFQTNPESSLPPNHDSLSTRLFNLDIQQAELEVSRTDFWHRLMPRIVFSASVGLRDIVFEETTGQPLVLPQDSYRLTVSLSLSDLLNDKDNIAASIKLRRLKLEREAAFRRAVEERKRQIQSRNLLREEVQNLNEQLAIHRRILEYRELEFEQGKADYSDVARAKLDMLNLVRSITRLQAQLDAVGP